jgi:hypothetical protein
MTHVETHATVSKPVEDEAHDLEGFLEGLTRLSQDCGIGIADAPTLYVLEREDRDYNYETDKDGRLVLR